MYRGKVAWFNGGKGFGFITRDDSKGDIFVHHTNIVMEGYRTLDQGDEVEFEIGMGPNSKPQAENVVILQKAVVA